MALPPVMLWAWERPEDLRFIDLQKIGVAFLAGTIELHSLPAGNEASDGVVVRPRRQPLRVSPGTPLVAVIRIESTNDLWHRSGPRGSIVARTPEAAPYTEAQQEKVASIAAEAAQLPGVKVLQIDFDAAQSEHVFYSALLQNLRRRLPNGMPLSVTALASWCIGDTWLEQLPSGTIDEAVPMLFRMGPDAVSIASYVQSAREFRPQVCRASLGLSTDESISNALLNGAIQPDATVWNSNRIYVFSPRAWTKQDAQKVLEEIEKWHDD